MWTRNHILCLLLPAILMGACATGSERPPNFEQRLADDGYVLGEQVERIMQYRLDGWSYLDPEHIVMQTGPSTQYLVSLAYRCRELGSAEDIAFTTTGGQLTRYDTLLVNGVGGVVERCPIRSLRRLEKAG